MPNTALERQKFKGILSRIVNKYEPWISSNRQFQALLASTDSKFDEIIHFESPPDFRVFLMSVNFKTNEGCSTAAMTLSRSNDDTVPYQRQIYFQRGASLTEHTIVHELFHYLAHPAFGRALKPKVVEGFTEYFTYKIIGAAGSAAAAAAATSDDGTAQVSGYADYTRNVETTRDFLKNTVFKFMKDERSEQWNNQAGGFLAQHRQPSYKPVEYAGVDFKNFTKRAYFKGDTQMIQFIKDQSGW